MNALTQDQVRGASRGRVRWADVACVGGIVASGVYYLVLIPAIPSLLGTHPVLLEAMTGSLPSELAAGAFARVGRASLALALAAPVLGTSAFDPFWWWAGRRYGDSVTRIVASRDPRTARRVERALRLFRRRGGWTLVFAYYLPVPNTVLYAAAGWTGYSFLRFAVLDLIGTMLRVVLDVGLGYALGSRAEHVAGLVTRYSVAATVALIAGLIAVAWWRRRRDQASSVPLPVDASWQPETPEAAEVATHLRPLVANGSVPGLVYAVITPGGTATGQITRPGGQPLGPHTMMEIGSVTKVFTALLLADMAERGEVGLDDPVARHLPGAVVQACPAAAWITLRQLATHTSGLPRIPRNLIPVALRHPADPYAGYTTERLYQALRRARRPATAAYRYSNYGFGLLGHLLSRVAGRPYGELVADRVTRPLGLAETGIGIPDGHAAADGHRGGQPAPRWHLGALEGAGALNSTASDMAFFLSAGLRPQDTSIRAAIETIQRPHPGPAGRPVTGLGWHICEREGRTIHWHNGGTGGFSAMLAFDRLAGCAVGALATSSPTRAAPLDSAVFAALTAITTATAGAPLGRSSTRVTGWSP